VDAGVLLVIRLRPVANGLQVIPGVQRPQEIIPALFFFFALLGYLRKGRWKSDPFGHWLVLSILLCLAQSIYMSTSDKLYDPMYISSHILKVLSYIATLVGLTVRERKRSLHVLIAEDNRVNQTVAVRLLEKRGHTTEVAVNGHEVQEKLSQQSFDLVLMDVQMPEVNGFEASAAIREKEKKTGGHLPIIAMTAHALKGDRERCLAAGMDGYISKPFRAEELWRQIDGLLHLISGTDLARPVTSAE
jgi:CheY-like chemotaxis protein